MLLCSLVVCVCACTCAHLLVKKRVMGLKGVEYLLELVKNPSQHISKQIPPKMWTVFVLLGY